MRLPSLRGTGVFLRSLSVSTTGTPKDAADRAREHGLSWVALMAQGLRGTPPREHREPVETMAEYAAAFREAGVQVWVWFFPLAHDVEAAARRAGDALRACEADGLILDIEKPFAGKRRETELLVRSSLDELREAHGIAVTSYPLAALHPGMAWAAMTAGIGMPQTYTVEPKLARRAVHEWRARGHTEVVPVVPAFGPNSGIKLKSYVGACYLDDGVPIVEGIGVWSWPQIGREQWRALEALSSWWLPSVRSPGLHYGHMKL